MALVNSEILDDLKGKYTKVRELLDDTNDQSNLEARPDVATKNKALDILKEMRTIIEDVKNTHDFDIKIVAMLAIVYLNMGIIYIDNEELKDGEENLTRCREILKGYELEPECILPSLAASNQLATLWFEWKNFEKAETFTEKNSDLYKKYKEEMKNEVIEPIGMSAIFGVEFGEEPSPSYVLEKLYTLTLYFAAQIYGIQKDDQNSALYCHLALQKQLDLFDFDHIDWALNAATLSQFLIEREHITQARHHLSAATHILNVYEASLTSDLHKNDSEEIKAAAMEQFRHRSADVARCWAKYGILLMSMSRERLLKATEDIDNEKTEVSNVDTEKPQEILHEILDKMKFEKLEKEIIPIEEQITNKYLLDYHDARKVFLNAQKWLDDAKKYYALETHASDYVHIVQDISQTYKLLSFFEDDDERQAKMHKRRIDSLEAVVKELNPRYYQSECRQIWVELGETYSAILDIKLDKLKASDERPTPHSINKINNLSESAIKYYQEFLDSLEMTKDSSGVTKFSKEFVRPALFAYFHIGSLYNKIISSNKPKIIENVKRSIAFYKMLVDYCETDADAAEFMKVELNVCKDLINLLPLKINKLM